MNILIYQSLLLILFVDRLFLFGLFLSLLRLAFLGLFFLVTWVPLSLHRLLVLNLLGEVFEEFVFLIFL